MNREVLLTTDDADRWRAALPASRCAMGSLEFSRILERQTGAAARLYVAAWDGTGVAYPFLVRPVSGLPFAAHADPRTDTFTAEYTGPRWTGPACPGDPRGARFVHGFAAWCRSSGVVAEFAHLAPWTPPELLDPAAVTGEREIVYLDLTWGEDELWKRSLSTDARRNVRQAERAGVTVRRAASLDDVAEFVRLYDATMARRHAEERFRYSSAYFAEIFEALPGNAFLALAEHAGRVVAGGVFLHDDTDVVWHLSAMDLDRAHVRPVNAYLFDVIRWAARAGKRRLLCGGGYQPGDGVARFKAGFSPLRARFQTYCRVHDPAGYAALVRAWSEHHDATPPEDFFPAYRGQPIAAEAEQEQPAAERRPGGPAPAHDAA